MQAKMQERADQMLAASYGADFDDNEDMDRLRNIVRFVLDEDGELIEKLPGIGSLEEFGLGTYRKQFNAAMRNPAVRFLRNSVDMILGRGERQEMLRHSHALKQELGKDWKRFYSNLLLGEDKQGLLMHLAETGDIDESYIEELTRKTGWVFNRHPLPIYEVLVNQASKQSKVDGGGLYKIILEIMPGEFRTFFAKKHAKNDEYKRTLKVQPLLARVTDKVSPILARDSHNGITVEKYINGETLTQTLKRISLDEGRSFTSDPVQKSREKHKVKEYNDMQRTNKLIPALDELVEISNAVEEKRYRFKELRTLGKGGRSFADWFREKYKPNNAELVSLIEKNITGCMDSEDTFFCHGDAHTDNVIEKLHKPHWIDWEFAGFSIPQWDVVKLLKRAGLSQETEADIVNHVCKKRNYAGKNRFSLVYSKAKIFDRLASAAKYHKLSLDSRVHRAEKQAQADVYFTDALELIEADETISEKERLRLSRALEKDAEGRLSRLAGKEYEKISKELDPYSSQSIENFGTPSIMEKYSKPPLKERAGKMWKKHGSKLIAGLVAAGAILFGSAVYSEVQKKLEISHVKLERISKYDSGMGINEKLMHLVPEYALKYDNITENELAAVINSAYTYNKRNSDFLMDWRQNPEPEAYDAGVRKKKELFKMKSGLSENQSFVKEKHLDNPDNNVFAAAKRLSDMKKEFRNIEDAVLAFFTSPEFVRKWKKGRSYWDYSKEKEFGWDTSYKHCYKTLTDMVIAYLEK